MRSLTDYITECAWIDVFTVWFVLVDDTFNLLYQRLRASGPMPTFADSEVITISLISDTYFHGNEELALAFVRQHYLTLFPNLLSNSRFNRRRRSLSVCIEGVRRALSAALIDPEDALRLTDSAPIRLHLSAGLHLPNCVGGCVSFLCPNATNTWGAEISANYLRPEDVAEVVHFVLGADSNNAVAQVVFRSLQSLDP